MALPNSRSQDKRQQCSSQKWRRSYSYLMRLDIDSESDLDFDSDVEFRLRAGAADEVEQINLDETPPEKPQPKKVEQQPAVKPPKTTREKIMIGLHYFKMVVLLAVWLCSTICLMTNKDADEESRPLAVPAEGQKNYIFPNQDIRDQVGVKIFGPFVVEDDLHTNSERDAPFLTVTIQRVKFDEGRKITESKNISSDVWLVEFVPVDKLRSTMKIPKSHVFPINDEHFADSDVIMSLSTNIKTGVTVKVTIDSTPLDKRLGIIYGSVVLVGLYIMIIWEIVDRTFASVISCTAGIAILAALDDRPSMSTIVGWLDVETLLLLFGMMVLVATLAESGIFDYLAVFAYKITKGKVWPLINCLCAFVTVLSAFLDNVTMMLLVTPVTIRLCEVLALNPVPILMCMVLFSNVGAALTPVGDPPNVIITTHPFVVEKGVNFGNFVMHMLPGVLLGCATTWFHLRFKFRKPSSLQYGDDKEIEQLKHEIHMWERAASAAISQDEEQVSDALETKIERLKEELRTKTAQKKPEVSYEELLRTLESEYPIRNKTLLIQALIAFCFVVGLFALHSVPHLHHLSLGWTALLGAIMLFIVADIQDIEAILSRVEWSTLLFFAALIILMEVLSELGLIELIGDLVVNLIKPVSPENRLMLAIIIILWVSAITSAFLDNIPVTTMMIRIVISLAQNQDLNLPLTPLIWALAFGACFGGNGTLIGASANVVCGGVAAQHGYNFGFVGFFVVGFPVVINTVTVATIYLLIAHVVFGWHEEY